MILVLDTSALVKLYIEEIDSDTVQSWVDAANQVCCQWLAYVESRSAFAARHRLGHITDQELGRCKEEFERDWARYHRTEVTQALLRRSGELAEQLGLRAYDSVHLAGAEYLQSALGVPVTFGTFDGAQRNAASRLGFLIAPPAEVRPGEQSPSDGIA